MNIDTKFRMKKNINCFNLLNNVSFGTIMDFNNTIFHPSMKLMCNTCFYHAGNLICL